MSQAITYTEARQNLAETMNRVCDHHEPVIITRQKSPSVVIMSLEDYNAIMETAYLLRSTTHAAPAAVQNPNSMTANRASRSKGKTPRSQ